MPTHITILDLNTLYLVRTSAYELYHYAVFFSCCLCLQFTSKTTLHCPVLKYHQWYGIW